MGGLIIAAGILLVPIAGESVDPPPANCKDPEIVLRPDSSVDAHISVSGPTEKVDTTMVHSPTPKCRNEFSTIPPNQD